MKGSHVFQFLLLQSAAVMVMGTLNYSLSYLGMSPPCPCRSLSSQPDDTLWITAVSLTVSKGTWNKPRLLNWSSSRAADFCWLVLVHGRMQSSHQLQVWAPCDVSLSLLWGCLVWSSKINSSDISPCFFQHCREPLQTGTLSGTEPCTPLDLHGSDKRESVSNAWGSSIQVYPSKFSETLNIYHLTSVDLNLV